MRGNRPGAVLMQEAGRRRRRFYRQRWTQLLPGAAVALSSLAVLPVIPWPFVQGVVVGVVCTALVATVWSVARETDGGRWLCYGAEAERWTATDLHWFAWWRLLHGQRWYVVHSIGFARGDVDHVLIGPGGVYAVDTKYRSETDASAIAARISNADSGNWPRQRVASLRSSASTPVWRSRSVQSS